MKEPYDNWPIKCDGCGRFISSVDIEKNVCEHTYIPSSEFTHEEDIWHCRGCSQKYGKPSSSQTFYYNFSSEN